MSELNITNSSNLTKATYDYKTEVLTVEFKNGTAYRYFGVPKTTFEEFGKTVNEDGSAGKFFNAEIKNKFSCEKIEE